MLDQSRRDFLKGSGAATAAAASFTIIKPELVRGFAPEKLKIGLVGCGGRGTQAVIDTLTANPNLELVAMADLFEDKLEGSLQRLPKDKRYNASIAARINVA